jgi:IstB-like ATP binding protein
MLWIFVRTGCPYKQATATPTGVVARGGEGVIPPPPHEHLSHGDGADADEPLDVDRARANKADSRPLVPAPAHTARHAEAGYRVRYTLASKLVNELVEAADDKQLSKTINRYGRVDLLCLEELGYMQLDRRGAELLF